VTFIFIDIIYLRKVVMYGQYVYILYSKFKFYYIYETCEKKGFSYIFCYLLKIIIYDNNYNSLQIFTKKNIYDIILY